MTNSILSGKKILFFGPETFNYEREIIRELESLGAEVTFRSDKPGNSFAAKALVRLFPKLIWGYSDRIFKSWLAKYGPLECDIVFIIKGEGLSPRFIDLLKVKYKNSYFVLYLWDSLENIRGAELKLSKFDFLYSFDPHDCDRDKRFKYRPLFFLERYLSKEDNCGLGCFFVGTLNGDRPSVILRLIRSFPQGMEFNYWLFVRNKIELFFRRIFDSSLRNIDRSRLISSPMPSSIVSQNFQRSAAIIDIEHPKQVGLTMRTFEVLASGKKLITTNKNIMSHGFYHSSRVCVIDRNSPVIDRDFISTRAVPLPQSFYSEYSLRGWILDLLTSAAARGGDR